MNLLINVLKIIGSFLRTLIRCLSADAPPFQARSFCILNRFLSCLLAIKQTAPMGTTAIKNRVGSRNSVMPKKSPHKSANP